MQQDYLGYHMSNINYLIVLQNPAHLYICHDKAINRLMRELNIKRSFMPIVRRFGLPDVIKNSETNEIVGISYFQVYENTELVTILSNFDSKCLNFISPKEADRLKRYKEFNPRPLNSIEITWASTENCIIEPASIMGDSWFQDEQGHVKALLLELKYFWSEDYYKHPSNYSIDVSFVE